MYVQGTAWQVASARFLSSFRLHCHNSQRPFSSHIPRSSLITASQWYGQCSWHSAPSAVHASLRCLRTPCVRPFKAAPWLQVRHYATQPPKDTPTPTTMQSAKLLWASVSRQQRRQLAILTGAGATLQMAISVVLPAFPMLAADIGMGASGVSLLVAMPSMARLIFNLPMGRQSDKIGRVPLMTVGEFLAAIGVACTGLATTLYSIVVARFLVGVGGSMASAGSQAYLADLTQDPKILPHRGIIMGIQSAMYNAAWVAGPALGGLACDLYGPRLGFLLVGAAIGLCGVAYATLPETLHETSHAMSKEKSLDRQGIWTLLSNPTQQGVLSSHFALTMNYAAMTVVIPLHAAAVWGATAGQIGILFSAVAVISLVGAPLAGYLADRHGRKSVIIPSLLFMALGSAYLGCTGGLPTFVIACVVWAFGEAFFVPPVNALTADCAPVNQKGEALSLSRQVADFGFTAGPLGLGLVYDLGGPIAALGVLGAINAATAAFVAVRVAEAPISHHSHGLQDGLAHVCEEQNL